MKKLLVYMKEYKKECVLGPLFKLLEASFELLVPMVMAAVIDTGIAHGDKNYIIRMCLVLVGLGVVGLVCSITAQFFAAKASVGFAAKIRQALFGRIQGLSYAQMDQQEQEEIPHLAAKQEESQGNQAAQGPQGQAGVSCSE